MKQLRMRFLALAQSNLGWAARPMSTQSKRQNQKFGPYRMPHLQHHPDPVCSGQPFEIARWDGDMSIASQVWPQVPTWFFSVFPVCCAWGLKVFLSNFVRGLNALTSRPRHTHTTNTDAYPQRKSAHGL